MRADLRWRILTLTFLFTAVTTGFCIEWTAALQDAAFLEMLETGAFVQAEQSLRAEIDDPHAPVTSKAAVQLEILRRIRLSFPFTDEVILAEIQKEIPDATADDLDRWRESGDLQYRVIDGNRWYFQRADSNLLRFNSEARRRRAPASTGRNSFDLVRHVEDILRQTRQSGSAEVNPVRHSVRFTLSVLPDHPRLKPGAVVRAWLPFPQEYGQQINVRLVRTDPADVTMARHGVPHRTLYFTRTIGNPPEPPVFFAEFEFVTRAFCPDLDPTRVQPYPTDAEWYREYTASRPPHIMVTPQVRQLVGEIVGSESNPLEKVRRIFRWTSENIPWCAELEYSVIPSLSEKGLTARKGDCGVQGLVFVTLCRAAGIPARWQSGYQLRPGNWNMHDWSEFYVEPWGWLPADASYGIQDHPDPRIQYFFCGGMDPYRLTVNLDYGRALVPEKISFRSEPNDFQRGEIEIDGHNLYFDEWDWKFEVTSEAKWTNDARSSIDSP